MIFLRLFLLLFLMKVAAVAGLEVHKCYIADPLKHASNQKLLRSILEQEMDANITPEDQANHLSARITQIAQALLKGGFSTDAYEVPALDKTSIASFNLFALWEGECREKSIPLTFFVYVWPSEEYALMYLPSDLQNYRYRSNIHRHPISCALAVLQGKLVQKNYKEIDRSRIVRMIDEEVLLTGEGAVDDLKQPFIHQLYGRGTGSKACITLHAYGLSSAVKVKECFRETLSECSYNRILQIDGMIEITP